MNDRPREVRSNSAASVFCALPRDFLPSGSPHCGDVVVLHTLDPESVEIALARQGFNIRDVVRSELRRELDDTRPTAGPCRGVFCGSIARQSGGREAANTSAVVKGFFVA
jgi:hypothetical protein